MGADMKNQSMGLMRTVLRMATLDGADMRNVDARRMDAAFASMRVAPARVGVRSYFSSQFLRSALNAAETAERIELDHGGDWKDPWVGEHQDAVLSAIVAGVTFFDTMVNELFADARDDHGTSKDGYLAPIDKTVIQKWAGFWSTKNNRRSEILSRYQNSRELA